MKFTEHYQNLPDASYPKRDFKAEIQELCGVTDTTVDNWVYERTVPDVKHVLIIANHWGKDVSEINLPEIYQNLPDASYPKRDFKAEIQELCGVTDTTVDNWAYGQTVPDLKNALLIANHLGEDVEELF